MNLNSIWSMLEESYDICSDIGVAGIEKFAGENHLSAGYWSWVPAIMLFPDEPISSVQWKCGAEGTTHWIRFSTELGFRGITRDEYASILQELVERGWVQQDREIYQSTADGKRIRDEAEALTGQIILCDVVVFERI